MMATNSNQEQSAGNKLSDYNFIPKVHHAMRKMYGYVWTITKKIHKLKCMIFSQDLRVKVIYFNI